MYFRKKVAFLILTLTLGFNSCETKKVDLVYVESAVWQWEKGFKIGDGDFVEFDSSQFNTLSHDTIYRKGIPRCIIIETNKEFYLMKVKSFKGIIGFYVDTKELTRYSN